MSEEDDVLRAKLNLLGIKVMKDRRTSHHYLMKGAHVLCHRHPNPKFCKPVKRMGIEYLWKILMEKDNKKYMWWV